MLSNEAGGLYDGDRVPGPSRTGKYRASQCLLVLCLLAVTGSVPALELRFDPYRLWQGLEGLSGGDDSVLFDLALDVPLETSMWGPAYSYFEDQAGSFQTLGVQWTRMQERTSGFYYGGGVNWLLILPASEFAGELAGVCRPAIPVNAVGRWGYRWQFNPVFNVQLGAAVGAGQITSRQAERCAIDGTEVDYGALQNVIDPRLDFKFSFRL